MSTPAAATCSFTQLMHARSVRGFAPEPVSAEVLQRAFALAQRSPSNCNVQPWSVHVVSGQAADRLRTLLYEHVAGGAPPDPDFALTAHYPGMYRARQVAAAKALFEATGVARDDLPARTNSFLRNFRFFDAPHAAFVFMPDWAGIREAADCGIYAQSLMLALAAEGLASCVQGALSHHAPLVRQALNVRQDLRLLFGVAIGYEATSHPANATRTDRSPLHDAALFHE